MKIPNPYCLFYFMEHNINCEICENVENRMSLENALQLSQLDDLMSFPVTMDFTTSQYNDSPSIVAANL